MIEKLIGGLACLCMMLGVLWGILIPSFAWLALVGLVLGLFYWWITLND